MAPPKRSLLAGIRARLGGRVRSAGAVARHRRATALAGRLDSGDAVWRAFVEAGAAMRQLGRFDEAERMLERGLGAFPADATLLYEYAFCAHNSGRYQLAIERWEAASTAAADLPAERAAMCRSGLAANLRELGRLDRARAVIAEARVLHPDDLVVLSEAARIAEAGAELETALALWRTALATPDPPFEWVQGEIVVLIRLGRLDEAEAALDAGRGRFAEPPGLLLAEAMLASARRDWAGAEAVWSAYLEHRPEDAAARDQLFAAREAGRSDPVARPLAPSVAAGELLRGVESLGDGGELAAVQRRLGIEPDGLLSRSAVTLEALVRLLDQRFAGLGEPENTRFLAAEGDERIVEDRRWPLLLRAPSGDRPDQAGDGDAAPACRWIAEARDRLLADLARAEKLFVYRSDSLDADRLDLLHRALGRYGPVRLLAVQPAAPTAPTLLQGRAGDVIEVGKGRLVGFLERFAGSGEAPAVEDWVALCRKASAIR